MLLHHAAILLYVIALIRIHVASKELAIRKFSSSLHAKLMDYLLNIV